MFLFYFTRKSPVDCCCTWFCFILSVQVSVSVILNHYLVDCLKHGGPVTPDTWHQSIMLLHDASENAVSVHVCVCVFMWDSGNALMPESDLVQAFYYVVSLWPPVRTLMRTQKRRPLLPALTVSVMELLWIPSTPVSSSSFPASHAGILSSIVPISFRSMQPLPSPARCDTTSCFWTQVFPVTLSVHSHWRDETVSVVFTQHIHKTNMIRFKGTHG